jgi:hypothetical protein
MNFKKFYINGDRFTMIIVYRDKYLRLEFELWWNTLMYKLTQLTTKNKNEKNN